MNEQSCIVYASLHTDLDSGYIWFAHLDIKSVRSVFKIQNANNGKNVFAEILKIDDNFRRQYQNSQTLEKIDWQRAVIINSWYRNKLGIEKTNCNVKLQITKSKPWGGVCASLHHPNVSIRIGTWLGLIGISLGVLGIALGLLSLFLALK
ncbi:MAG TPA: hypothetical protein VJS89_07415 [Gammaproteobacteria bacterium]|nr:hypothetical protein [Gammaproteobacteria bacterium]